MIRADGLAVWGLALALTGLLVVLVIAQFRDGD